MAANPATTFDVGPLTWVKTEIDHSLAEARQHLDKVLADPADEKSVKYVATHLHQVAGALSMVGLGAATRFTEEIEKLIAALEAPGAKAAELVTVIKRGMAALSGYLDSLIAGHPDRPMMLAPAYVELNRARGGSDVAESDLFHPDLALTLPPPENTVVLPSKEMLEQSLKQKRATFQAGLLKLLRDKDLGGGLRSMRDAVLGVESLQLHAPSRTFWFTASGFFDAVAHNPKELGSIAVAQFGKIDQQIKLLQEGIQRVPERVFRDLLLVIDKSNSPSERVRQIRQLYRLDDLLAVGDTGRDGGDDELKAQVRTLRELTIAQKDNWLKYTSGNRAAIEAFVKQSEALVATAAAQPNQELSLVLKALASVGATLRAAGAAPTEALALEVATALLFVENSLENYFKLSPDFSLQAKTVAQRVVSTMSGATLPPLDPAAAGLVDDMTRRAQERMLMFQVGQEVQVNLQSIEQVLDNYFRDPLKIGELGKLASLFAQVQGALTILELDEAAALNQLLSQRVGQFASGARRGEGEDAETVAEGVSALGLYVSALQQGQSNPREVLLPALIRFGLAMKPAEPKPATVTEGDIETQKQRAQELFQEWQLKPEATHTRDQLKQVVTELKRDAELVADQTMAKQSGEALSLLDQADDPSKTGLYEALQIMAPAQPSVPMEPPTQQTVQLLDKEVSEVDAELLEIFLEEATEVVATINDNLTAIRGNPLDREALITIRRGFHTLKGSGRMVGLTDLGEVAWQVEQVLNKWLKQEAPPSAALLRFIALASDSFGTWVLALQQQGTTQIDGAEITRIADAFKNDKEPDFGDAAIPPAVAEVAPVAPASAEIPEFVAPESAAVPSPLDALPSLDLSEIHEPAPAATHSPAERIEASAPAAQDAAHALQALDFGALSRAAEEPVFAPSVEEDVVIGEVVLPTTLFSIYLSEADQHVATLNKEIAALEASPLDPVTHDFMRAAHTLNSSSRTTGFTQIAEVAQALEKWLQDAIELPPEFDGQRLDVTRQAVDALTMMIADVSERNPPLPREDVVADLKALREGLAEARRTGEGTHVKVPQMFELDADEPDAAAAAEHVAAPAQPGDGQSDAALNFLDELIPPPALATEVAHDAPADAHVPPEPVVEEPTVSEAGAAAPFAMDRESQEATAAPHESHAAAESAATHVAPGPPADDEPLFEAPLQVETDLVPPDDLQPAPAVAAPPAIEPVHMTAPEALHVAQTALAPEPAAAARVEEPAFEAGKEKRRILDDIDKDLLPIFLEEAKEIIPQLGDCVRAWKARPEDHSPVVDLARHLHTLKGSARMAGLMRLGELAHVVETRIIEMDREAAPASASFEPIEEYLDRFTGTLDRLQRGEDIGPLIDIPVSDVFEHQKDKPGSIAVMAAAAQAVQAEVALEGRERQALLRVNADMIDRFVNEAGELSIARSRIDIELIAFKRALQELTDNVSRMKTQLREIEIESETQIQSKLKELETHSEGFDPLEFDRFTRMQEVTRFLAESLSDVVTLQLGLQKNIDETEAALLQQGRLNRDLQQGLMGVRLVPLGNLQDRLYRVVRQTAKELEKKANLEFRGARVELDRSVLEKITAPFEHLLRNAVSHGLETPAERTAKGKPEIGEIFLDANQVGNEVVLTITDDGAGLNYPRIRAKAIEAGLLDPNADVPDEQITQYIFMPGFSTATEVTQISGRGVGMDVVRSEIISLGGRIEITSVGGKGTSFTITLPLTLAVTQAVMVKIGDDLLCIPSVMVEQVQEYKGKKYDALLDLHDIDWKGNRYPLRSLHALLGGTPVVSSTKKAAVILAKSGTQRAAVQVDEIIGNREIVVKPIGPQLARLPGVSGATVLGNGQVVLILNPVQLVFRDSATISVEAGGESVPTAVQPNLASLSTPVAEALPLRSTAPLVMVVDDSLTVRKITSRMLTREGFEVATAKDGVDGLKQLQDLMPDMILLDIEMPRMDGFEFARNVRADAKTGKIPIIMITSRTADKHRNRAMELGVNEYMGKPYQEEQLLALIRSYTGLKSSAAA